MVAEIDYITRGITTPVLNSRKLIRISLSRKKHYLKMHTFTKRFNIILVYLFQRKPTSLTKGTSLTFDESFTRKWLKTIDISIYFI